MNPLSAMKLLLPALFPSWNFFDVITPSPFIQFSLLKSSGQTKQEWHMFRPLPKHLSFMTMLRRIFWNSQQNETLFLLSCAEKLIENSNVQDLQFCEEEILKRISKDLHYNKYKFDMAKETYIQFRLVFVTQENTNASKNVVFISRSHSLSIHTK